MHFDLTDLRLFVHVHEAGSITGGAQRSHLALASASEAARWLAHALGQVADLHEQDLYTHLIVRTDDAVNDPAAMAALLEQAFGVPFSPAPSPSPATIEAGHWRRFAQVLGAEFALLGPVAARLGYPEA